MLQRFPFRTLWLVPLLLTGAAVAAVGSSGSGARETVRLPAMAAIGVRYDTLLLGGYAAGSFTEAVRQIAGDLSESERAMVGQHLDRVFSGVLDEGGLGRSGRLRAALERASSPDGTTRSVRVLAAEAAVAGRLHTAFYFEHQGEQGYFDAFGRSVDPQPWIEPLAHSRVSSRFGHRRLHPILNRVLPHTGVDYAAPPGAPVRATGDGVVVFAGDRGGYGTMVEIQHPSGYATRYAHLSRLAADVAERRQVRQGTVIGYVGMSGLATGPHLHYEVRAHGRAVDPERTAGGAGPVLRLSSTELWPEERHRLSLLLSRAPTVLHADRLSR